MFRSFFPRPALFFPSTVLWLAVAVAGWYGFAEGAGPGLGFPAHEGPPILGLRHFVTPAFQWFYLYCLAFFGSFTVFWFRFAPHPYQWWAIVGSGLIVFSDYISVQISVAINNWRGPFFDDVQTALSGSGTKTVGDFYALILIFCEIAFVWVGVYVVSRFFISHYVFRWRTAMNDYYMEHWPEARHVEGAAQRVQEDTMRFAQIVEDLGVSMLDALMTLAAFLPVLAALSKNVTDLPIVGAIPYPLLTASIFWSVLGTLLLAVAGIRLPGLNFNNQRVEAAYRKELVYGEDDPNRAEPPTVRRLFDSVRRNYFRLYFHYGYFNVARGMYLQADNVFAYVILIPTIVAGKITFGLLQQILTAFGQVSSSFQYLISSWSTIIELLSIHKRLKSFEAAFLDAEEDLPSVSAPV